MTVIGKLIGNNNVGTRGNIKIVISAFEASINCFSCRKKIKYEVLRMPFYSSLFVFTLMISGCEQGEGLGINIYERNEEKISHCNF